MIPRGLTWRLQIESVRSTKTLLDYLKNLIYSRLLMVFYDAANDLTRAPSITIIIIIIILILLENHFKCIYVALRANGE